MKTLFFVSLLSTFIALSHELKYENYLQVQSALAKDDFKQALSSWKTICEKDLGHYAKEQKYDDCTKPMKTITELRNSFKALSEIYIKNGETIKDGSIVVASCPMAKARWLQKSGSVSNPYYGKDMLQCGEIEKK